MLICLVSIELILNKTKVLLSTGQCPREKDSICCVVPAKCICICGELLNTAVVVTWYNSHLGISDVSLYKMITENKILLYDWYDYIIHDKVRGSVQQYR